MAYLGGTWQLVSKTASDVDGAVELVAYLTGGEHLLKFSELSMGSPPRKSMEKAPYVQNPLMKPYYEAQPISTSMPQHPRAVEVRDKLIELNGEAIQQKRGVREALSEARGLRQRPPRRALRETSGAQSCAAGAPRPHGGGARPGRPGRTPGRPVRGAPLPHRLVAGGAPRRRARGPQREHRRPHGSTRKVAILATALALAHAGELRLEQPVELVPASSPSAAAGSSSTSADRSPSPCGTS